LLKRTWTNTAAGMIHARVGGELAYRRAIEIVLVHGL